MSRDKEEKQSIILISMCVSSREERTTPSRQAPPPAMQTSYTNRPQLESTLNE